MITHFPPVTAQTLPIPGRKEPTFQGPQETELPWDSTYSLQRKLASSLQGVRAGSAG